MSQDFAIRLRDVGKTYRLYRSPGERLKEALHPGRRRYHQEHRALDGVTFDVPRGCTLGLLGLNGSGKSTLLQIIAGVLEPTQGDVEVNGRVAALLELGAGFNPELTGRENALTNAMVLGLSDAQARAQIPQVEAFADIGRYFDQPVKTYSSGMFMRVAFASSICVDPDIMIVDEALAVGDVKFQEKCFRRLREFQALGRTILFVTHDRGSVTSLCDDSVLLHQGRLVARGAPKDVVDLYTELLTTGALPAEARPAPVEDEAAVATQTAAVAAGRSELERFLADRSAIDRLSANPLYNVNEQRWGNGGARVVDALVVADGRTQPTSIRSGCVIDLHVKVAFDSEFDRPLIGMTLTSLQGVTLYGTHSGWLGAGQPPARAGEVRTCRFRLAVPLAIGAWFVEIAVARDQTTVSDVRSRVLHLEIQRERMLIGMIDLDATFKITGTADAGEGRDGG
jgi:lipopolysaccharide transport system ATP-binding protein